MAIKLSAAEAMMSFSKQFMDVSSTKAVLVYVFAVRSSAHLAMSIVGLIFQKLGSDGMLRLGAMNTV